MTNGNGQLNYNKMELIACIENLRNRLKNNQYRTEQAIRLGVIDEILRALDWKTSDPLQIVPEYSVEGSGRVDYALFNLSAQRPHVFIEAKKRGVLERGNEYPEEQLFRYDSRVRVPIAVLTDGEIWRFFFPSGIGTWEERKVKELRLTAENSQRNVKYLERYLRFEAVQRGTAEEAIKQDYEDLENERRIRQHLPQTWENLVKRGDELLIDLLAEATEDDCGHKPSPEQVLNFLKGLERKQEGGKKSENDVPPPPNPSKSEKYQAYFQAIVDELTEQHHFADPIFDARSSNVYYFPSGDRGIWYYAHFAKGGQVWTGLRINFTKKVRSKKIFDVLKERESEINATFDALLRWDRLGEKNGCRIKIGRDGSIESTATELAAIRAWHVKNLLKFKAVFTPEIQRALEKLQASEIESEEQNREN